MSSFKVFILLFKLEENRFNQVIMNFHLMNLIDHITLNFSYIKILSMNLFYFY